MREVSYLWGLLKGKVDEDGTIAQSYLDGQFHSISRKQDAIHFFLRNNFGHHYFPYLKVGDLVLVKCCDMKKPIKVKLFKFEDNGDLKNCLIFKYKNMEYYLSKDNFIKIA